MRRFAEDFTPEARASRRQTVISEQGRLDAIYQVQLRLEREGVALAREAATEIVGVVMFELGVDEQLSPPVHDPALDVMASGTSVPRPQHALVLIGSSANADSAESTLFVRDLQSEAVFKIQGVRV